jgi:eukaryotic-like serine/threonine-protein kinase
MSHNAPTQARDTAPTQAPETAATRALEGATRPPRAPTNASAQRPTRGPARASTIVLDRYRLTRRLGAGAFGTVWAARDERLDRDVAVKIVPRERVLGGRFEREARAAARLSHPAIVTLYEAAIDDEGAYLVSELVDGATLAELLDAGRLSDQDIVALAIALCDALEHAHAHGVVHRDVKPSNVLVPDRPTAAAYPAKLTDFGVALVVGGDSLTRTGDVLGTAAYMAPEQAEGRETGAAADLYALALVTYEALTGVNPVQTTTAAVRARRLGAHLPPLRRQRRDLPQILGRGIDLALRPRPRERGQIGDLRRALVASLPALTDTPGVVESPWARRREEPQAAEQPLQAAETARDDEPEETSRTGWPARALGAGAAALATVWLMPHVLAGATVAPAAAATLVALIVLALPRIGWIATIAVLSAVTAARGHPGAALLLALAALPAVFLLPRNGAVWPLGASAPVLGALGLAGACPALAARAGTSAWRRAALAAGGWIWLALATPIAGRTLYVKAATVPSHKWMPSLTETFHAVLTPLVRAGTLNAAPVWAAAAVALPWLVRGRSLAVDAVLATIWTAVTLSGTEAAIAATNPAHAAPAVPTAIIGAVAGGLVALAPSLVRALRLARDANGPRAELA